MNMITNISYVHNDNDSDSNNNIFDMITDNTLIIKILFVLSKVNNVQHNLRLLNCMLLKVCCRKDRRVWTYPI